MRAIRNAATRLLADPGIGFNPILNVLCIDNEVDPFVIDFEGAGKAKSFYAGYYSAAHLIDTTSVKFPVMCLYTVKSQNQNLNKFRTFSGAVMVGLDIYLSHGKSSAMVNCDDLADAVDECLYRVFNQPEAQPFFSPIVYNGDLTITRSPLAKGATNWLQQVSARFSVDLDF